MRPDATGVLTGYRGSSTKWAATMLAAFTLMLGLANGAWADAPAGHRVEAAAIDNDNTPRVTTAVEAADPVSAARRAWRRCDSERATQSLPLVCEIVRVNDVVVTSGAALIANVPPDPRPLFLWRFESPRATLYLAGSIHVAKPSLYPLPAAYETAFARADHIAVEVDPRALDADRVQRALLTHARLPPGKSLAEVLGETLYTRLAHHLAHWNVPIATFEQLTPAFAATQIAVQQMSALGYWPEYGIEAYFLQRSAHRRVHELETFEDQLSLLARQPQALQRTMLAAALVPLAEIEAEITQLVRAWLAGDDAELERAFTATYGATAADAEMMQAFTHELLAVRNRHMASRIDEWLAQDGTWFVLVGAAHLTGDEGIPALLTNLGRHGTRLSSGAAAVE
jgi:uncharacterized protein